MGQSGTAYDTFRERVNSIIDCKCNSQRDLSCSTVIFKADSSDHNLQLSTRSDWVNMNEACGSHFKVYFHVDPMCGKSIIKAGKQTTSEKQELKISFCYY